MSRKPRHLQVLEEAKALKIKSQDLLSIYDEAKKQANIYAISIGKEPPNKLSYEK